jgi:choloylglycine hydrolase
MKATARRQRNLLRAVLCASLIALSLPTALACTRVLWNNNKLAVVVSRTMDWPTTTDPIITVFPRGMKRDRGRIGPHVAVADNPANWTSKYGSLVTTVYGVGTADGFNEKAFAVHMLYLTATDFGPRDETKLGVRAGLWGQYLLDNAATVDEALKLMNEIQPVMVSVDNMKATVHLAIEDATGDSAILEYIDGKRVVHHGHQYRIMTNDPTYDQQLANRARYDFTNATRQTDLPGNVDPRDRFVRADYYLQMLPEPKSERAAMASILSIARNVSVPFGAPNNEPGTLYNTEYRTAMDLTNRFYFFELTTTPNVIWMNMAKLDLKAGAPVLTLDPDDINLSGDVTAKLRPAKELPF